MTVRIFGKEPVKIFNVSRCRVYHHQLRFFHSYIEKYYDVMIISLILFESKILTIYRLIEDIYSRLL